MILDKNGKLFGKISIIDLFVILAVIVAAIGISVRFVSNAAKNVNTITQFTYEVKIDGLRIYSIDALNKKGLISDIKTGSVVGEIVDVEYEPSKSQYLKADGTSVFVEEPERYTAYVTISSKGRESDEGYFIGSDTELSVGSSINIVTKYVNTSGIVKKIEK